MTKLMVHELSPQLKEAIQTFNLPNPLGFGQVSVPIMASCHYKNNSWGPLDIIEYAPISLDPSAKSLHYGQLIFEGMKCYRNHNDKLALFRPEQNWQRFNFSARRLAMPEVPEDIFMNGIASLCHHLKSLIPDGDGESLYLRPFMIATEPGLGLAVAKEYHFMVLGSPSGAYFSSSEVNVVIEREEARAAPGGTGSAKVAGNYAGSLKSLIRANELGYQQNMWLDAAKKQYIEELSGMNFFAVINDVLFTPKLTGTILPGITRDSLVDLAKDLDIEVKEVDLDIEDVIGHIKSGACTEMFACGTAAVITPVSALGEKDGTKYKVLHQYGPVSKKLRESLDAIQRQKSPDPREWVVAVP